MQQAKYPHVQANSKNTWQSHFKTVLSVFLFDHFWIWIYLICCETCRSCPKDFKKPSNPHVRPSKRCFWIVQSTLRQHLPRRDWSSTWHFFGHLIVKVLPLLHILHFVEGSSMHSSKDSEGILHNFTFSQDSSSHQDSPRLIRFSCYSPIPNTFEVVSLEASKIGIRLN